MSEHSLTRDLRCLALSAAIIACGGQKTAAPEISGGASSSGASALGGNPSVLGTGGNRASGGTTVALPTTRSAPSSGGATIDATSGGTSGVSNIMPSSSGTTARTTVVSTLGGTTSSGGGAGSVPTSSGGTNLTSVVTTTDECAALAADYAALAQHVQACNPALSSMQCRALHRIGLVCACEVVVNLEQHADAVKQLDDIAHAWRQLSCSTGAQCGACMQVAPVTTGGGCTLEGTCISLIEP